MGLFNNQTKNISWSVISSEEDLKHALELSFEKPVCIFKHSIRCGISAMIKHQLEFEWDLSIDDIQPFYLDLINYRNISNLIAENLSVPHQSPQIIVIKHGHPIFSTSHHAISTQVIKQAIAA